MSIPKPLTTQAPAAQDRRIEIMYVGQRPLTDVAIAGRRRLVDRYEPFKVSEQQAKDLIRTGDFRPVDNS